MLSIHKLALQDAYVVAPIKQVDNRGSFQRVYCKEELSEITKEVFVQINHSISYGTGTVRGMHFQYPPYAEMKMVKCIRGAVFDVIVDLRRDSPTFLEWHTEILSDENMKMLCIPKGFAHGFQTLEEQSELLYFHTEYHVPKSEGRLHVKDPRLSIKWPHSITNLSAKDNNAPFIDTNFSGLEI